MNTRFRILLIGFGALLVAGVFTFPLWQPLFTNTVVEEEFPGLGAERLAAFNALEPEIQEAFRDMIEENAEMGMETMKAALGSDTLAPADEQTMPTDRSPEPLRSGAFTEIDAIHRGEGRATLYQLADNSLILRLEDFRVTNGPDLHVYLTRTAETAGTDYIDLGSLKGNVGNQNYAVPSEVNLDIYRYVMIWCEPFRVVFSTAELS